MPLTPKKTSQADDQAQTDLPFGAVPGDSGGGAQPRRKAVRKKASAKKKASRAPGSADPASGGAAQDGAARDRAASDGAPSEGAASDGGASEDGGRPKRRRRRKKRPAAGDGSDPGGADRSEDGDGQDGQDAPSNPGPGGSGSGDGGDGGGPRKKRRRRRRRGKGQGEGPQGQQQGQQQQQSQQQNKQQQNKQQQNKQQQSKHAEGAGAQQHSKGDGGGPPRKAKAGPETVEGMFFLEKGQVSVLRAAEEQWLPTKRDIYVPKKLVQQFKLHDGMIVRGPAVKGPKKGLQLQSVDTIDGQPPAFWKNKPFFKNLTSIDPDFHYAVGDVTDDVSMRVLDLIAPIGRGQRGLLVAPPRTGKTTLMRQFAAGMEKGYPDVHLMVLLIDERPEEATEWTRSVENGQVFVSTADETAKNHINLAEVVWRRAMRLVEMGEDVVLLLDSITRLARAYNNQSGAGSGRTMSGGLDSRAMERPRKFFGSARNTVEAGSLTILGTTLVETGSRMDQLVFEEFKGTGNMELVLNRKLADRRIFPAIDIEKSGTRKEEKLVGLKRLKLIHVLRRVLARMHFAEAAELLITRLDDVEKTDDFLERFTVDPEA